MLDTPNPVQSGQDRPSVYASRFICGHNGGSGRSPSAFSYARGHPQQNRSMYSTGSLYDRHVNNHNTKAAPQAPTGPSSQPHGSFTSYESHHAPPQPQPQPRPFGPFPKQQPCAPSGTSQAHQPAHIPQNPPKDLYAALEVLPTAAHEELKAAYHKLRIKHHPDKFASQSEEAVQRANDRMAEINEAWEWLGDREKRMCFDETGEWTEGGFERWRRMRQR